MKITKIETIISNEFTEVCWIRIHCDDGRIGLGETWYLPKTVSSVIHELFAPQIIGLEPINKDDIWNRLFRLMGVFTYSGAELRALSAIDIALWDALGGFWDVLGGIWAPKSNHVEPKLSQEATKNQGCFLNDV